MPSHFPAETAAFSVCRDGDALPAGLAGAVVAIGNFDGVHRGHRALIAAAQNEARAKGCPSAALTFEPHPRSLFQPEKPIFRLTPECLKLALIQEAGLDGVVLRRFDRAFASLTAGEFVGQLLARDIKASGVVVGYDFHFGQGREGNPERLRQLCVQHGLSCTVLPAVAQGEMPVSSSAIRAALETGDVASANRLLGYRWLVTGEVRHGDKRGRNLGFPTANLALDPGCGLRHGIYAVRVRVGGDVHDGVASFGRRPTFDNGAPLLEVFLFDFQGDLYGRTMLVEFVCWIRGEERFDTVEALVDQMHRDAAHAREAVGRPVGGSARSLIASLPALETRG